ncbi:AraC family transcriptional regulator [Silvimonas soli]|uniref:AraC family transcriptional regulator n=1 Tax=Silvimonas soli TaxID=2980100 RepID=UPI0024B337CA|nr:helix-turn-helix domain-containing protein [Silvimonas soli]
MSTPCLRLERAINRMVRDLSAPLTLADLADAAHYSPWYLVRRFQSRYATTPQAFLWRLRLETAASILQWMPKMPIGKVALTVGFSSAATFSRAFHREFGFTPSEWRKGAPAADAWRDRNLGEHSYKPGAAIAGTSADYHWSFAEVNARITIEHWDTERVVYIREVGEYGCNLDLLWKRFRKTCTMYGIAPARRYGLIWSDPATTPSGRRRYDAAQIISPQTRIPRGLGDYKLQGGRWAVFRHHGPNDDIGPRWRDLMLTWVANAKVVLDPSRPRVERYEEDQYLSGHYELCLPLMTD